MNRTSQPVAENRVDRLMTSHAPLTLEELADQGHLKMRLGIRGHIVAMTFILYRERAGVEGILQRVSHFSLYSHVSFLGFSRAMLRRFTPDILPQSTTSSGGRTPIPAA